jgi:hypothetical protein
MQVSCKTLLSKMLLQATLLVSMPYLKATMAAKAHRSALDFPESNRDLPPNGEKQSFPS